MKKERKGILRLFLRKFKLFLLSLWGIWMKEQSIMNLYRRPGRFITLFLLLFVTISVVGQHKNQSYLKYIDQYSDLAVKHQKKYRIPASITLSQGILESGAGQGKLALRSNNHFGIKCHTNWSGGRVYHDDDLRGECFRKYKHVEESYEDHSKFLAERPRYAPLFKLSVTDYRGWAKGLQQCGYATDKAYANKLIKLIEDYELYKYDTGKSQVKKQSKKSSQQVSVPVKRMKYKTNGLLLVFAQTNDTFESLAKELGVKEKNLRKFNEVPKDFPLRKGDIVYLQKKKKKADKYKEHTVGIGESMHSISQKYGIRIKNLYKMNNKREEYVPQEGDILILR